MALSLTSDSLIISNVPFRLESLRLDRNSGCSVSSNFSLGSAEVETGDDVLSEPGSFSLPQLMGKLHTDPCLCNGAGRAASKSSGDSSSDSSAAAATCCRTAG